MTSGYAISSIATQAIKTCERIKELSCDIESEFVRDNEQIISAYKEQRLSQLEDLQELSLLLTELIFPDREAELDHSDEGGGVFAEGELTDVIEKDTDGGDDDE